MQDIHALIYLSLNSFVNRYMVLQIL